MEVFRSVEKVVEFHKRRKFSDQLSDRDILKEDVPHS